VARVHGDSHRVHARVHWYWPAPPRSIISQERASRIEIGFSTPEWLKASDASALQLQQALASKLR
jgi:hypothetical protein